MKKQASRFHSHPQHSKDFRKKLWPSDSGMTKQCTEQRYEIPFLVLERRLGCRLMFIAPHKQQNFRVQCCAIRSHIHHWTATDRQAAVCLLQSNGRPRPVSCGWWLKETCGVRNFGGVSSIICRFSLVLAKFMAALPLESMCAVKCT